MTNIKGLNCSECPPEQTHEILFKCPDCKGSYCSEHKNKDAHTCVYSPEIVSDEQYLPPRMKPDLIKSQINHLILSTRGWITLGFEPLDYTLGLVFVLFAGVFQLYLTQTFSDLEFIVLVIGLVLVYSLPLFFQRQVSLQVGVHPRYVLHQSGMLLTILTGILSFGIIQPGQIIPFGATHSFQRIRVSNAGPISSLS
ncbi:MAG: AN1-type zinc finger protein, partial [Candidatus Kariarchaeaceae archaeon]